jgi:hypothetical protein
MGWLVRRRKEKKKRGTRPKKEKKYGAGPSTPVAEQEKK